jgi:rubrerythrin
MSHSLRELREERGLDQTLQNLMRALTLNLELRARYRVFEFEASQDGHPEVAELFRTLREAESEQIAVLMAGLQTRLSHVDLGTMAGDDAR